MLRKPKLPPNDLSVLYDKIEAVEREVQIAALSSQERKPRILIVDDDEETRLALAAALGRESYDLKLAATGSEALRLVVATPPDVAIIDQTLPGFTGADVCAEIRKMRGLAEVPILLLVPVNDRQLRLKAIDSGADDVLSKPIDSFEIQTRVKNITRLNRYRSLLESRNDVSRMLDQVRRAYDQTIAGWALALELRDDETKGHSVRVTTWTVDLALSVGIKGEELEHVRRGALLHDIGKMGVPDAILRKAGPLDANERRIMQRHPTLAYEMLSAVEYLAKSIHIPYCHHERWDGQGYPQGLSGESIPYTARLFSIVDVFDALTSDRPYRQAWDSDKAVAYLKTQTGTHFDPDVVSVFTKLVKSGGLTRVAGQANGGLYLRFE